MAPLRVLALDLSLAAAGLACTHDSKGGPRLHARTICPRRSADRPTTMDHTRVHKVFAAIRNAALCQPDVAVIEWLPQLDHRDTSLRLAELHGVVKQFLWSRRIPYVDVLPTHLQMYATGKGRATKQQVREAATARYGSLLHIGTEDEADATTLLAMALDAYGQPLAEVPDTNRRALAGCRWPDLIGTESASPHRTEGARTA